MHQPCFAHIYISLDKRKPGEITLIQTQDLRSNIQVPKTLKWSGVTFPENWTLENDNYPLQIQNPSQNPDLDFIQQLTDGTIRLSFDQSRFRSPVDLHYANPRFRSPIDLPQPSLIDNTQKKFNQNLKLESNFVLCV